MFGLVASTLGPDRTATDPNAARASKRETGRAEAAWVPSSRETALGRGGVYPKRSTADKIHALIDGQAA